MNKQQWIRLFQIFVAKMVLEIFGGAGAIWGFSEAVGLRTPETVGFWRPTALTIGFLFFIRWMMQIRDYIEETHSEDMEVTPELEGLLLSKDEENGKDGPTSYQSNGNGVHA